MTKLNVSRNKVLATREELQKQIEDNKMIREMQKNAKLGYEVMEREQNDETLRQQQEKKAQLKAEAKAFVQDSLNTGKDKRNTEKETDDICRKNEEIFA